MKEVVPEKEKKEEQQLVTTEMRRLFMEIGLMGFGSAYEGDAMEFFLKLRVADPNAAYPIIGLAFMHILLRKPDEAEQHLLDLELSSHGQDPYVLKWIQSLRKLGNDISQMPSHLSVAQAVAIKK